MRERNYPEYTKINLDPKKVPVGYGDSSRRCVECETRWPNHSKFLLGDSPCCRSKMTVIGETPSMTWPEAIKGLKHYHFNKWYEKYNEGKSEAELEWNGDPLDINEVELEDSMKEIELEINELTEQSDIEE